MAREVTLATIRSRCRIDERTGCWEWTNAVQANGYGRITVARKTQYVHRLAFTLSNGPIPKGKQVCNTCDNRKCCNPEHLFAGTHKQKMRGAMERGRVSRGMKHSLAVTASSRARAKLDMEKARSIRRLHADGVPPKEIAPMFDVDVSNVRLVVSNKTWKEPLWLGLYQ